MKKLKILVACEESQAVTKEFRALGHEAYSCDLYECSGGHPEWHYQKDVTELLKEKWDLIIAFPPCTHLCVSGAKHFVKKREDGRQREAIEFFMMFINADCEHISVENPVGIISGNYISEHFPDLALKYNTPLKFSQAVQPYFFGDAVKKTTCLWLKGLPNLTQTNNVENDVSYYLSKNGAKMDNYMARQIIVDGKKYGYDSDEMKKHRSKTFPGLAKAMATQWSEYLLNKESIEPTHKPQLSLF